MKLTPFSKRFFVFDVESIGLHGEGFAVAGGVTNNQGGLTDSFCYACLPSKADGLREDRAWVTENIPPIEPNMPNPIAVMETFWKQWRMAQKDYPGITMAVECGWPVEANFVKACIDLLPDSERMTGPYPLHEIASFMLAAGMDPMDTYDREPSEMPKHHPLADARQSARLLFEACEKLGING